MGSKKVGVFLVFALGLVVFLVFYRHSTEVVVNPVQNLKPVVATTPTPAPVTEPVLQKDESSKKLSSADQKKLAVLEQIFASRNDNDPRMDTDLLQLSPELKQVFIQRYQQTAPEKLNERGTLVFLLGRKLETISDIEFMKTVLLEKPCLSFSDCTKTAAASAGEAHLDAMNETTASYPQLMGLRALSAFYQKSEETSLKDAVLSTLQQAVHAPNPRIAEEAREFLKAINKSF